MYLVQWSLGSVQRHFWLRRVFVPDPTAALARGAFQALLHGILLLPAEVFAFQWTRTRNTSQVGALYGPR